MNFSELMSLAAGHVEARLVQTALELEVFDALESSALTAQEVAERRKFDPSAAELLLNALTALQLLHKSSGTFSLAGIAQEYLVKNSPHYVGAMIRFESALWSCWEKLPEAIRSGRPVRLPNMYQDDPNETEIFINAMDSLVKARGDADALASTLNWNDVVTLLDIGAGPATYPIELCKRFSNLRATVFDLPGTLKITERYVHEADLAKRIELIAGDYRSDPIPGSYDVIFLSNIIHGENDEKNTKLIDKLARNLNPSGRIVIKDHILDDTRVNPPVGAIFSLLMLLTTDGGRCYSFGEIRRWMETAGLRQVRQIDLPPPLTSSLVIGAR
jgi:SAM-dependent methyltransferase